MGTLTAIAILGAYGSIVGLSLFLIGSAIYQIYNGIGGWGFDMATGLILVFFNVIITMAAHDEYKKQQAHPCIEWKQTYDVGGIDPVCIKRKP
jgi:ABC-type spermidine/putrescine transport system permease subunit I